MDVERALLVRVGELEAVCGPALAPEQYRYGGRGRQTPEELELSLIVRLLHGLVRDAGCLIWTRTLNSHGYGSIQWGRRRLSTHVAVHELLRGPVAVGLELDHSCRRTACADLDHLEAVTHRENMLRGFGNAAAANASKTVCPYGHLLDGVKKNGRTKGGVVVMTRFCTTCKRAQDAAYRQRRRSDAA